MRRRQARAGREISHFTKCIQVSYGISAEKTRKGEINGLLLAERQTKCENLLLLTDHESEVIRKDGHKIKVQLVYEWILED